MTASHIKILSKVHASFIRREKKREKTYDIMTVPNLKS